MNQSLTVFTAITASYSDSDELQLCLDMLRDALPPAKWVIHNPEMSFSVQALFQQKQPADGYVLFLKEPALLMGNIVYPLLEQHLINNPEIIAVLPSDPRNTDNALPANYHTLRGFENYNNAFSENKHVITAYDGREPWVFLISAKNLSQLTLPKNPFELPGNLAVKQVGIALDAYSHHFFNY